jgi:hypothetical protein
MVGMSTSPSSPPLLPSLPSPPLPCFLYPPLFPPPLPSLLLPLTAKRRHLGRVGGAKRPSGRNNDLRAAL